VVNLPLFSHWLGSVQGLFVAYDGVSWSLECDWKWL